MNISVQTHTLQNNEKNKLLLNYLMKYYMKNNNLKTIIPILNGDSDISIRLIDWFVTNYSKQYFIVYTFKTIKGVEKRFKVYSEYKLKLKAHSKKCFDPFCRYERINIQYDNENCIQTTLGQLNFFKWALENHILDYIRDHKQEIEYDMNSRNSTAKKKKQEYTINSTRKKREELSISAVKSIKKENVEVMVEFSCD